MQRKYSGNNHRGMCRVVLMIAALGAVMIAAWPVPALSGTKETLGLGGYHSCAIMDDSSVSCWGQNLKGQLGDGTNTERHKPQRVLSVIGVTQVAAGEEHSCALKNDGTVWCWGRSDLGQLGNGTGGDAFNPTYSAFPSQVSNLYGVVEIAAGGQHNCARKSDGTVWCWGWGTSGQVGNGQNGIFKTPSQVISLPYPATTVEAGYNSTCAILSDGSVWCWGDNTCRQLGRNPMESYCWLGNCHDLIDSNQPLRVPNIPQAVNLLAVGNSHICAGDGVNTWCWGSNSGGDIGDGTTGASCSDAKAPTLITTYATDIIALKAAKKTSFALRAGGIVLSWGDNSTGMYGNGTQSSNTRPAATMYNVSELAVGGWHACARMTDGRLSCWGNNINGQVGDDTSANYRLSPTPVAGITSMRQTLSVSRTGTGSGMVTSSPAGISCGSTCSAGFTAGSQVILTASADSGSAFGGWSGACAGTGSCSVFMDAAKSVVAVFNLAGPEIRSVVSTTSGSIFYPTSTLSIWGSNFSAGGNRVQMQRVGSGETVTFYNGDGHYFWDFSGTQINVSLDSRVAAGTWSMTVKNSSGAVSMPYTLTIQNNGSTSNAYYCYCPATPYIGYYSCPCNGSVKPEYCFTSNWQLTTCPSGGGNGSVCGNGICEAGENGSNCGQDCCDQYTSCWTTRQNDGVHYCRNMLYIGSWQGFKWVTASDTTQMCNDSWEAQEGAWYQTQYQCGGYTGKCHGIPAQYY